MHFGRFSLFLHRDLLISKKGKKETARNEKNDERPHGSFESVSNLHCVMVKRWALRNWFSRAEATA